MELLKKLRNLLLVSLTIGVVFALAPIQTTSADYYEENWDYDSDGDEGTSYGASSSSVYCDAYIPGFGFHIYPGPGNANDSDHKVSYGISYCTFEWVGLGTPTGGTWSYDIDSYGWSSAGGQSAATSPNSAGANSSADGNAGANQHYGYGLAEGSVNNLDMGEANCASSDSSCDESVNWGYYSASAEWDMTYLYGQGEIAEGTSYVVLYFYATCEVKAYAGVSVPVYPGGAGASVAGTYTEANVDIYDASFDPN